MQRVHNVIEKYVQHIKHISLKISQSEMRIFCITIENHQKT
jgi:hypothetical protein